MHTCRYMYNASSLHSFLNHVVLCEPVLIVAVRLWRAVPIFLAWILRRINSLHGLTYENPLREYIIKF